MNDPRTRQRKTLSPEENWPLVLINFPWPSRDALDPGQTVKRETCRPPLLIEQPWILLEI